jgi:inorganic phosphate transporter, PiT family
MTLIVILVAVCLAYANGANDNFKGVATLFGSGTTDYGKALRWGTLTTLLGSLTAVVLAGKLLKAFTGRGLIADELVVDPRFVAAVALGAGATVLLATRIGMPVSTTHGLVGALVGAGWASGSAINGQKLLLDFFGPLLVSPFLAIVAACVCYPILHRLRLRAGVTRSACAAAVIADSESTTVETRIEMTTTSLSDSTAADTASKREKYDGTVLGVEVARALDGAHFLSAGAVGFARGLNDTPKIAALLMVSPLLPVSAVVAIVAFAMAVGGLISARRVAEVMSRRITPLNHGQGLTANLITATTVIAASRFGLPVSTTHVSCGALFGIGTVTGEAHAGMIATILGAWLLTLPIAACLAAAARFVL